MPCVLVQYLFDQEEHEIVHLKPHVNSKSLLPNRRSFSSTLELMKTQKVNLRKSSIRFIALSVMSSIREVLASYLEVLKIYTVLDIKFPKARNLREITKLNRLFSWINCGYY